MENQTLFKFYAIIELTNPMIDIGKLIGHKGCNLKPIATKTGTNINIRVDKDKENTEIVKIKIQVKVEDDSSDERINKAKYQMIQLVEDITKKEEKKVRFSDDDNHQHTPPPRNQRSFDSKERRNNFNQESSHATNAQQVRYFKNI